MDIPLNTPICLKAHSGNNLQNDLDSGVGICRNQNTMKFEQMILHQTDDNKIIIQSCRNGKNLQVQASGKCVFATRNQLLWEKFDVSSDQDGKVYFTSVHTGKVMQCNERGRAYCTNHNLQAWEAWTIIYPKPCMEIPLNTPICLKAYTGNNLQNEFCWRRGKCDNQNTLAFEQMILLLTEDQKIIIQSRWNGRNLQVKPSGECVFATHNQLLWEKFDVSCDQDGKVYFTSVHTGKVMQCNEHGFAYCANHNRQSWEAWTIIHPESSKMMTSLQLRTISLATAGALVIPVLGITAGALVPLAMAGFGTVVAGVGTFHAPLFAGGCAAAFQVTSAAMLSAPAIAGGAFAGGALGAAVARAPINN